MRLRDGRAVIDLPPQIDATADAILQDAYTRAAASGPTALLLNFSGVDYINSTGIALIVGILSRARRDGRAVSAFGVSDHYREIFEITRLSDFITMFVDERSALAPH